MATEPKEPDKSPETHPELTLLADSEVTDNLSKIDLVCVIFKIV